MSDNPTADITRDLLEAYIHELESGDLSAAQTSGAHAWALRAIFNVTSAPVPFDEADTDDPAELKRRLKSARAAYEVGKAFHDLAVKERNLAWRQLEQAKRDVAVARSVTASGSEAREG